jgi:hypothetical protein
MFRSQPATILPKHFPTGALSQLRRHSAHPLYKSVCNIASTPKSQSDIFIREGHLLSQVLRPRCQLKAYAMHGHELEGLLYKKYSEGFYDWNDD